MASALEIALESRNHALVLLLLCNGYDQGLEASCSLDLALRARRWDLVDMLLEWGADPHQVSLSDLFDTYRTELFERFRGLGVDLTARNELAEALAYHTSNKPLFGFARRHREHDPAVQRELNMALLEALKPVEAVVTQYAGGSVHLAFEACGFGYEIAWWAAEHQIDVTVIAPSRMERAPGRQVKTDRLDVGTMARKLEQGALKGIYVPSRTDHERRQLVRTPGRRSGAPGDVRATGPADRPPTRHRGGDAPAGGPLASSLARSVGGGSCGRVSTPRRRAERSRRLAPNRGRLRHAGWTPPRGGSLGSLAALASQDGHGALPRATDDHLVAVLSRTRSNNRLATTRLGSAPSGNNTRSAPARTLLRKDGSGYP
jgi:hypothetical protein